MTYRKICEFESSAYGLTGISVDDERVWIEQAPEDEMFGEVNDIVCITREEALKLVEALQKELA